MVQGFSFGTNAGSVNLYLHCDRETLTGQIDADYARLARVVKSKTEPAFVATTKQCGMM